ncbi:MAG: DUF6677 family protein [Planctomycetota bacterium]
MPRTRSPAFRRTVIVVRHASTGLLKVANLWKKHVPCQLPRIDHEGFVIPTAIIVITAWALPGLGHLLLGRRTKAVWFALLIFGTLGLGLMLSEGTCISSDRFPFHFYGQVLAGVPIVLADAWAGSRPQGRTIDRVELGLVFTTVAGIMNLIATVDAYEAARRRHTGQS